MSFLIPITSEMTFSLNVPPFTSKNAYGRPWKNTSFEKRGGKTSSGCIVAEYLQNTLNPYGCVHVLVNTSRLVLFKLLTKPSVDHREKDSAHAYSSGAFKQASRCKDAARVSVACFFKLRQSFLFVLVL